MCAVSAVLNYGQQTWPNHQQVLGQPIVGWPEYQELLRKAAEFDRISNQPDCHDPAKGEWYSKMEERMRKIEEKGA